MRENQELSKARAEPNLGVTGVSRVHLERSSPGSGLGTHGQSPSGLRSFVPWAHHKSVPVFPGGMHTAEDRTYVPADPGTAGTITPVFHRGETEAVEGK